MARKGKKRSELERAFLTQLRWAKLPDPEPEYKFHPQRRWRLDFAWPSHKVAVEVEGGTWGKPVICHQCGVHVLGTTRRGQPYRIREAGGRHTRGKGFENDVEKYNEATALGWQVFRVTSTMLRKDPGSFMDLLAGFLVGAQEES